MQIEAYKDLATGRVFESPDALADFQAEQKKAAETAARIETIRTRLKALRGAVRNKLETVNGLPVLVHDAYQEILDLMQELVVLRGIKRTKAQQRKIDVVKVAAGDFKFGPDHSTRSQPNSGIIMTFNLSVTLTRDPYGKLFCEEMPDVDFETIIGMRSRCGCAWTDEASGMYFMRYSVSAPLKQLPLMYPRIVELIEMAGVESQHSQALQLAQRDRLREDPDFKAAKLEFDAAERAIEEAISAKNAVVNRITQRVSEIEAAVEQATPFEHKARYDKAHEGFTDVNAQWESMRFYL